MLESKKAANRRWDKKNLERITVVVRKGKKEEIKKSADAAGESLNNYIVKSIEERMNKDGKMDIGKGI